MQQPAVREESQSFDGSVRRLFAFICKNGADVFCSDGALEKYRDTNLLRNMIAHFEKSEEYEKCAFLKSVAKTIISLPL